MKTQVLTQLDRFRAQAQARCNASGEPIAILNLNRVGAALYVMRQVDSGIETDRAFVEIVSPIAAPGEESANV